MTPEEIKMLRILATSKAVHGGTIDARLVVMAIDALQAQGIRVDPSHLPTVVDTLEDEVRELRAWRDAAVASCAKRGCSTMQHDRDEATDEVKRLRGIANDAACWLEANTDKSARRFHAARIRAEVGQ